MRALYERFPLSSKGYTTSDLKRIVEELSGADFSDVFEKNISEAEPLDFEKAFAAVGIELSFRPGGADAGRAPRGGGSARNPGREAPIGDDRGNPEQDAGAAVAGDAQRQPSEREPESGPESRPDTQPARSPAPKMKAYLGLNLSDGTAAAAGKTTVTSVLSDGPAYLAGILAGDEIIAMDGRRLTAANLNDRLTRLKPGQTITLTYFRRDDLRTAQITLAAKPDGRWTLRRMRNPTEAQKTAYESWLGQKW
jgi:predicted metalloprotease with PDZ domain